ncbi:hypothetical protein ACGFZP_12765 [Kitasatospora sp. NPDC048239]|uniref:hypothetical protein n=1 Tax=Kitasatospora sp. NPDC048239 TaxID=3364046 RepID=UPI0037226BF0
MTMPPTVDASWRSIVVGHIADALLSDDEGRHAHACRLAQHLDEAGLNVDLAVDDHIHSLGGPLSPRDAWSRPSARRERFRQEAAAHVPF